MMKLAKLMMWAACTLLLISCQPQTTSFSGPSVEVDLKGASVTVSAYVNSNGEIVLSGTYSQTLVRTEVLNMTWDVGFETTLNQAATRQNTLFILYKDDNGEIIQQEYAINQPFEINFSNEQWVKKIQNDGNGNIVVSVEHKVAQTNIEKVPTQMPPDVISPTRSSPTNTPQANAVQPSCSNITVTVTDTSGGEVLHIKQCSKWTYDTPPLAKGVYAVDPHNKFIVYCTTRGEVYVIKVGVSEIVFIESLKDKLSAFKVGDVSIKIGFYEEDIHHYAIVKDQISGQEAYVKVPPSVAK